MRHRAPFLTLAILATLAVILTMPSCAAPASPARASVSFAPDVPLVTLAGDTTDLARVTRGRVALVSLWATWCEGCAKEMGALQRLDARSRERGEVIVVGVAVGEERARVDAYVKERGLPFLQLVDEDFHLADALGERRVPTTLVLDRSGRIVFRGAALDGAALAALREAIGGA